MDVKAEGQVRLGTKGSRYLAKLSLLLLRRLGAEP
jgi:hypothetical protein